MKPGVELHEDVPGVGALVEKKLFYDFRVRMWLRRGDQFDGVSRGVCTIAPESRMTAPRCSPSESTASTCSPDFFMEWRVCELVARDGSVSRRTWLTEKQACLVSFRRMHFSSLKYMSSRSAKPCDRPYCAIAYSGEIELR
jgi:hypothetical protein